MFVRVLNKTSSKRSNSDNTFLKIVGVIFIITLSLTLEMFDVVSGMCVKLIYTTSLVIFAKIFYLNYLVEDIILSLVYYTTSLVVGHVLESVFSQFVELSYSGFFAILTSCIVFVVIAEFIFPSILDYKNYVFTNKEFIALFSFSLTSFLSMSMPKLFGQGFVIDFIAIVCVVSSLIFSALIKIIRAQEKTEALLIEKNKFLEQQDKLVKEKEEAKYKSYQKSVDFDDQVRRINHDLMHHFNYLLACDGLPQKARDYINKLKGTVVEASGYFNTGSSILDLILEEKCRQAEKEGIKFRAIGDFSNGLDIEPASVSIIFGNLLNNAIEGVRKVPSDQYRVIDVVFYQEPHHRIYIKISNTACTKDLVINNGKIETTKKDKKMHGIGLDSVHKEVSKYSGRVIMSVEENSFIVEIVVPVH